MAWTPDAVVTINGTDYTAKSLNGVSITYGRSNVWEQPRASYANIDLINLNDSSEALALNQSVVITVKDFSGDSVTVFTGVINSIDTSVRSSNAIAKVSTHRINAVGPFTKMARTIISGSWPKEYDDDRMDRILTAAGVTIDAIDTPGIYEFTSKDAPLNDAYFYASYYAQMGFGLIYETTDGKVGYANESHRTDDADLNGYFTIPTGAILSSGVTSSLNLGQVTNKVSIEYKANAKLSGDETNSQGLYGIRAADILTELEQQTEVQTQLDRYLALRAFPRVSLSSFIVQLDIATLTESQLDGLLRVYIGKPIQVSGLPTAVYSGTYQGFVEGWTLTINREQASLNLITSEALLSLSPQRWNEVTATLEWEDVNATLDWVDLLETSL